MVEIKNISVKPICIGGVSLLPGTSNTVEDAFMDAVNFYVDMGFVEVQKKKRPCDPQRQGCEQRCACR